MNSFIDIFTKISNSETICKKTTCHILETHDTDDEYHSVVECKSKAVNIDKFAVLKKYNKKIVDGISINKNKDFFLFEFKHLHSSVIDSSSNNDFYKGFSASIPKYECFIENMVNKIRGTIIFLKINNINISNFQSILVYKFKNKCIPTSINYFRIILSNIRKKIKKNNYNFKFIDYNDFQKECKKFNIDIKNWKILYNKIS